MSITLKHVETMGLVFSLILVCNISTLMASKMLSKRKGIIEILKNAINKDIIHTYRKFCFITF